MKGERKYPETGIFTNVVSSFQLTSQHPYAEVYIGKPHVWTVDINDLSEVERAVKSILNQKVRNVVSICNQHLRVHHGTCVGFHNVSLIRRLCFVGYWGKNVVFTTLWYLVIMILY